ncbi:MAG: M48 family metallopeptidase [Oscillospiraceae bacterium]|jgi:predicted metal-dependent hydrolase|nr:M48 family metallopeptidase [Oscillospiraceae bacterium]
MTDYTLTRSSRKTIGLYVRNGAVEVRAPLKVPKADIDRFIRSKREWIEKTLAKSVANAEKRESFTLDYGDAVTYLGEEYPIAARPGDRAGFDGSVFYMPPELALWQIKDACVQIYRLLAKRVLTAKTLEFAKQMGVTPLAVKINGANTRWGSCSAKRSINFSWRLIMAGGDVVDYVVVHELAHITEMNHSPRFWEIVAGVLPDYKARQTRLKELQARLNAEDWE